MKLCQMNFLTPAELLRPFGDRSSEHFSIYTSDKTIVHLSNFVIEFYDCNEFISLNEQDQAKIRFDVLLKNSPSEDFSNLIPAPPNHDQYLKSNTFIHDLKSERTPWFDKWKASFMKVHALL